VPDPEFPGLKAPNPEDPAAMGKAIELARNTGADIALGTDPDADRLGAAIRNDDGEFVMLSGNQIGCLIAEYLLRQRKEKGELAADDYIVKSFVSTSMADEIAKGMGAESITVPTGFKYISDVVNTRKQGKFVFGFEESCGFLAGDFVADKDGVMALLLLLEVMCECSERGETLYQRLISLFNTYGWHKEKVTSTVLDGESGMAKKEEIMQRLRKSAPQTLGGQRVAAVIDYLSGVRRDGERETIIDFPRENALRFELGKGWVCVRPSGTEPKIKLYAAVNGKTKEASETLLDALWKDANTMICG
jgi:phosphoglucomutase